MVDSTNLPEVDINQIATDLNGKMDRDCLNASDTGKIQMASMGMPSDTYIDLTLNASGASYTAPANGYYYINTISSNSSAAYLVIINNTTNVNVQNQVYSDYGSITLLAPVLKGQQVAIYYGNIGGTTFKFYYAVGSESEAS